MSSPQCPRCGTALKDEYGMSQCPGCGVFSFVDMEGNAFISEGTDAPIVEAVFEEQTAVKPETAHAQESQEVQEAQEIDAPFSFDVVPESVLDTLVSPETPLPDFASDGFVGIEASATDQTLVEQPSQEPGHDFGPANDPLGLNDFANSELSSAKDGPLLFRILISGIDTKEIRESIREVLEDSRFAWDSADIFSRVKNGNLAIDGVSPIKASIFVTRIKRLPVTIRWEQYAITQAHS